MCQGAHQQGAVLQGAKQLLQYLSCTQRHAHVLHRYHNQNRNAQNTASDLLSQLACARALISRALCCSARGSSSSAALYTAACTGALTWSPQALTAALSCARGSCKGGGQGVEKCEDTLSQAVDMSTADLNALDVVAATIHRCPQLR